MWTRILHTGQIEQGMGRSKSYWPVGVMDNIFFCLLLQEAQTCPGFPWPLLRQVSIRLPFKRIDSEEAVLEEQ